MDKFDGEKVIQSKPEPVNLNKDIPKPDFKTFQLPPLQIPTLALVPSMMGP